MILLPKDSLIVALDTSELAAALNYVEQLREHVGLFKVGLELFTAVGPDGVRALADAGARMFLDLKLHDIPNTVTGAMRSSALPGVAMISVHAMGGSQMLKAAARACALGVKLLAVTMLTSLDEKEARDIGVSRELPEQVVALARMAVESGADGIISSAREVAALRQALGPNPLLVTPGIRPMGSDTEDDQARVADPVMALRSGSNYLVVGRPILQSSDPVKAAQDMVAAMKLAFLGGN